MSDQPLSEDNNQASYGTNAAGGPNAGGAPAPSASRKMQATKKQVDEVVDIMRSNVEAVLERDAKISMMDDRADALHQGASQFETQAAKLKNKFWLENMKYMIALGIVVVIVIAVAVYKYKDNIMEVADAGKNMYNGAVNGGGQVAQTESPIDVGAGGGENAGPTDNNFESPQTDVSPAETDDVVGDAAQQNSSPPENADAA